MKQMLIDISRRIDDVLDESMTEELMKLSEESIMELYEDEPDLYRTQSRNQVISRFFQGHNDAHLTVTCEV